MSGRAFRFGVVASAEGGGEHWRDTARRVEELGYATLLAPDGMHMVSPMPSLAVAASVTANLRVGTFVLASPLRPARLAAWDAHSLSVLLNGRFELGIGTGRPEVIEQAAGMGLDPGPAARRLTRLQETIDQLRELDGDRRTPVMVAASGPKVRAMAAAKADIVALTRGPLLGRDEMRQMIVDLRAAAGDRADALELVMNILVVGEQVPRWMRQFGADAAALAAHDSMMMLRGTPRQMADELQRRRDALGTSYVTVNSAYMDRLAPVVELLAGR